MNLRRKKKTTTSTNNTYNDQGFYETNNYNGNTYTNNTDQYYDNTQQNYQQDYDNNHDENYDENYTDPNTNDQYYDDPNTTTNTNTTTNNDYYYEPEPSNTYNEPIQEKQSRFQRIRPRSKHKSATSFKPQTQPPISNNINPPPVTTSSEHNYHRPQPTTKFTQDFQSLAQEGLRAAGVGPIGSTIMDQAMKRGTDYIPKYLPSIMSLNYYKYYFRVDNEYVLKKLSRILLPFLKLNIKEWKRRRMNEETKDNIAPPPDVENKSYEYQSPIYDINAPDGYLPLMAIVTYIVIMGFMVGYQSSDDGNGFSPQILIATGSSAFVMLIIEVLLMKIGFYLIGSVAAAPYWLDIVCYTGYKLVFVTINLIIYLIFPSPVLYYGISIGTGVIAGLFMIQTLRPYFRDLSEFASGPLGDSLNSNEPKKTRKIFLGIVGCAQILFIQFMGRYTTV